jgi:hypothetical protein
MHCIWLLTYSTSGGHLTNLCRSRSYFTTDSQSVCLGVEHPCETYDQILLPVGMSKLLYDWRSVSQYVLVSSTLVGLATRYYFLSECRSPSYFTTDGQSVSTSLYRVPLCDFRPDITSCRNVEVNLRLTVGRSVSMSWYWAPLWDLRPDITSCRSFAVI